MKNSGRTLAAIGIATGALSLSAFAGPTPSTPIITRQFTVFVGEQRIDTASRIETVYGGVQHADHAGRDFTAFGGLLRNDAWSREASVERGPQFCAGDFDGDGETTVPDIFAFLSAWFASDIGAEYDGVYGIDVPDIFSFLSAWFAGCD